MKINPKWIWVLLGGCIVLWLFNVSRSGIKIDGCLSDCAVVTSQSHGLRVISLNMLHGFPRFKYLDQRLMLIASELDRKQPDIVLLQEVSWTLKRGNSASWLADQLGMNFVYLRANGNRWTILFEEGEAILSRYPLTCIEFTELQPNAGFFERRVALRAEVATPLGNIPVVVTHLTHSDDQVNQGQLTSLIEFVEAGQNDYTIIGGDFNASPNSDQVQSLQAKWIDTFTQSNPGEEGYTCCIDELSQRDSVPDKRLDYLFLVQIRNAIEIAHSERVFSRAFEIDDGYLWASDHIGIKTDFILYP